MNTSVITNYVERQNRLADTLQSVGLAAAALNPSQTLTYLTGLHFHLMERPVVVIFSPQAAPAIVLPELEMRKVEQASFPMQAFPYSDNPATWGEAFQKAVEALALDGTQIGIDPRALRVLELRFLEAAAPRARFVAADTSLGALRLRKDASEVENMRKAVEIAQNALLATLPAVHVGMTELDLASELVLQLLKAGSQSELAFAPIVSGGPNSANPHAVPSLRPLQTGDLLVIDWGAMYNGYISDLTRTFVIGEPTPEQARIAQVVAEANQAGRSAAKPDILAGSIDRAARQVIEQAGYGAYFTHRVGHGIGMEGHEDPYMFAENQLILEPGMAFTVEPGIYLPGKGGVRIEDNLVITHSGSECLSSLPRALQSL